MKNNNILLTKKLYDFLIDEENKKLITTLINLLLFTIFITIFKSNILISIIFYLILTTVIKNNYLKLINKIFKKNSEQFNNYF